MGKAELKELVKAWVIKLDAYPDGNIPSEAFANVRELSDAVSSKNVLVFLDLVQEVRDELGIVAPNQKWIKREVSRISK
jgi:hypothetical protein